MTAKILLLLAIFLPTSAWAQSAELVNQAKKEGGEVILYTTMTVGTSSISAKPLKKSIPASISVMFISVHRGKPRG